MLKAEQIPDKVVWALWEATGEEPVGVLACLVDAKIYLAAAINAWPGMSTGPNIYGRQDAVVHLPLPTENTND